MNLRRFGILLGLILSSLVSTSTTSASVQLEQTEKSLSALQISLNFPQSTNRGGPKRTSGGGRRSGDVTCLQEKDILPTVLMPLNNVGTTVAPNPTMFWYIPETRAEEAEFVIVNSDTNEEVYYTSFALPENPGIIQLQVPAEVQLFPQTNYRWSLAIVCDTWDRSKDEIVRGILERIQLTVPEANFAGADTLEKARIYSEQGAWNETLLTMLALRQEYPQEWQEFLISVDLEEFLDLPIYTIETILDEAINPQVAPDQPQQEMTNLNS